MSHPVSNRRVVLITGAAGGLGHALVQEFLKQGWNVLAGWHRRPMPTPDVPDRRVSVAWDVTQSADATTAVERALQLWGRIDVLIHNAGIARDSLVATMQPEDWDDVIAVNVTGAFYGARAVSEIMVHQRDGHILTVGSFGGRVGRAGQVNYSASKAALLGLTQSLARELGSHGIRVNAVLPGFMRTALVGDMTEAQLKDHAAANVLGRLNQPEEVSRTIVFLSETRNISGQIFQLDSRILPWS